MGGNGSGGGGGSRSNETFVRARQVLIPLGLAAAATYAALVRQEGSLRRRVSGTEAIAPPQPTPAAGPPSPWVAEGGDPVLPTWEPTATVEQVAHVAPPADVPPVVAAPEAQPDPALVTETPDVAAPSGDAVAAAPEPAPPVVHASPYPTAADATPSVGDGADDVPSPANDTDAPSDDANGAEEWTEMQGIPDLPAATPITGEGAQGAEPEGPILDDGQFSIGGWAAAPGHSVVSAVTYHHRLPVAVPAERVVLTLDNAENVPEGGLVVLSDPGFAPDREGFTLLLAAADPGPFSASGTYRVIG